MAWRTVLEHRFLDESFFNCRALPGAWQFSQERPVMVRKLFDGASTGYAAGFAHRWARLVLDEPVADVIGLSVNLRIGLNVGIHGQIARADRIMGIGDDLLTITLPNSWPTLTLDGEVVSWDPGGPLGRAQLRCVWMENGRFELHVNDKLVAFRNDVHRGRMFAVPSLFLGPGFDTENDLHRFLGSINYVGVAVLTRNDSASELADWFRCKDKLACKPTPEQIEAGNRVQAAAKSLMGSFFDRETDRKWQRASPDDSPFRRSANAVHGLAMELARAAGNTIARGKPLPDDFEVKAAEMFALVARSDPERFRAVIVALEHAASKAGGTSKCDHAAMTAGHEVNEAMKRAARSALECI